MWQGAGSTGASLAARGRVDKGARARASCRPPFTPPAPFAVSRVHTVELRVRYAETDKMGVVYHANYLVWCEVGRTDYIRAAGMSYREMEDAGVGLAVSDATIRFHGPARYDDLIVVETRLTEVRSRPVTFD